MEYGLLLFTPCLPSIDGLWHMEAVASVRLKMLIETHFEAAINKTTKES